MCADHSVSPAGIALAACLAVTAAQGRDLPAWEAKLDTELAAIAQDCAFPLANLAAAVVRGGNVTYERQFGRRRIDARNPAGDRPADEHTLYRVASISKLVTALGVMRLVEAGTLALDRDVSGYLGYRLRNPHFPEDVITLRMLLSHTASLRDDGGYFWGERVALRDVLLPGGTLHGNGAMWARNAKPGAYFTYANLPWGVVGEILESTTGERFDRLMRRLVLEPLGVPGGFSPAELSRTELANLATLYRKMDPVDGKEVWKPDGPWVAQVDDYAGTAPVSRAGPDYRPGRNGTLFSPQGGLRTSAAGLARIARLFLEDGRVDGKPFLEPASVAAMLARQWQHDPAAGNGDSRSEEGRRDLFNAWGLGVQHYLDLSGPGRGDRLVAGGGFAGSGHRGDAYGLTAIVAFDRVARNALVYVVGGVGADPEAHRGKYSALHQYEERILTALYRRAIRLSADDPPEGKTP